jgi:hypothetical protein
MPVTVSSLQAPPRSPAKYHKSYLAFLDNSQSADMLLLLESARYFLAECSTTFTFIPLTSCAHLHLMYITSCIYSVGQSTQFSSAVVDALSTTIEPTSPHMRAVAKLTLIVVHITCNHEHTGHCALLLCAGACVVDGAVTDCFSGRCGQ